MPLAAVYPHESCGSRHKKTSGGEIVVEGEGRAVLDRSDRAAELTVPVMGSDEETTTTSMEVL